jgi:hypothetical protein
MPSIEDAGGPIVNRVLPNPPRRTIVILSSVILLNLVCLWMSVWIIPRFEAIFRDMLDGQPLPPLTVFVLNSRWVLVVFDCICSLTASFFLRSRVASAYLFAILFILVGQVLVTVIALFLPLIGTIVKLSPPH